MEQRSSANQLWIQYLDPATSKPYWHNEETCEYFWADVPTTATAAEHSAHAAQTTTTATEHSAHIRPHTPETTHMPTAANATEHSTHIQQTRLTYEQARELRSLKKNISADKARDLIIRPCYQTMARIIGPREVHINCEELDLKGIPWREALASAPDLHEANNPIIKCTAWLFLSEADPNYEHRPRLDLVAYKSDGTWVRWHPEAIPIWSADPTPQAVQARQNRAKKIKMNYTVISESTAAEHTTPMCSASAASSSTFKSERFQ